MEVADTDTATTGHQNTLVFQPLALEHGPDGDGDRHRRRHRQLGERAATATVTLAPSSSDQNYEELADESVTVIVTDDDVPVAQFAGGVHFASEVSGSRTVSVKVSLSPGACAAR